MSSGLDQTKPHLKISLPEASSVMSYIISVFAYVVREKATSMAQHAWLVCDGLNVTLSLENKLSRKIDLVCFVF
jgi:hypothetical protein